jgi:hypothetical protein
MGVKLVDLKMTRLRPEVETIQRVLLHYEGLLPHLGAEGWDLREWPHADARVGMRVHRLWRAMGADQLMLHRFLPEEGVQEPHPHPKAVAAHVLGPNEYEVGFIVNGACQARMISTKDFYYEMTTPEVKHYVYPQTGPVYSVAVWTDFPDRAPVPKDRLQRLPARVVCEHVVALFEKLWPLS